jgi:hypothetical protein
MSLISSPASFAGFTSLDLENVRVGMKLFAEERDWHQFHTVTTTNYNNLFQFSSIQANNNRNDNNKKLYLFFFCSAS